MREAGKMSGKTGLFRLARPARRRLRSGFPSGHSAVEVALLSPWILLLFMGVFDFGFYAYALISVQNAARVAALYTSSSPAAAGDTAGACVQVLEELRPLPNVAGTLTSCAAPPVQVSVQAMTGAACAEGIAAARCSRVVVTYTSVPLFRIPGLMGQMTVARAAEAKVKSG